MAPSKTKGQQKATEIYTVDPVHTPQHSPQRMTMRITAAQKQALIDNLQLEVTERARKLRAQYSLQAQSLRTRIEMRVNRIPTAMRKANMGELYAKYEEMQKEEQLATRAQEVSTKSKANQPPAPQPARTQLNKVRGKKRNSEAMDDERDRVKIHEDPIPNPKKRAKVANETNHHGGPHPSTVLSPKSANSRTLPQSPIRYNGDDSPHKAMGSRATSPLKPLLSTGKTAAAAATATLESMVNNTKAGRPKAKASKTTEPRPLAKRQPKVTPESEGLRTVSSTSNSSAFSTGTTIVKATKKAPAASAKGSKKAVASKAAPAKKVTTTLEPPAKGRRVLRTRA